MSAELELLQLISKKQDIHTDAINKIDKKLAVNNEQIKNIQKMGCAPGVAKIKYVHERVNDVIDNTDKKISNLKLVGGVGAIVAAALSLIVILSKYI